MVAANAIEVAGNTDVNSAFIMGAENRAEMAKEEKIEEEAPEKEELTEELSAALDTRATRIKSLLEGDSDFKDLGLNETFNARVDDFFRIIFSDKEIKIKGKTYPSFWYYFKAEKLNDREFTATKYTPEPPNFFSNAKGYKELLTGPDFSERNVSLIHPVKKALMPSSCMIKENHKVYWVNHNEFYVDMENRTEKFPYCDTFYIKLRYSIKKKGPEQCEFSLRMLPVFVKSTIMRKTIESEAKNETTNVTKATTFPLIKEVLAEIINSAEYQAKYRPEKQGGAAKTPKKNSDADVGGGANAEVQSVSNEKLLELSNQNAEFDKKFKELSTQFGSNNRLLLIIISVQSFFMILLVVFILFKLA